MLFHWQRLHMRQSTVNPFSHHINVFDFDFLWSFHRCDQDFDIRDNYLSRKSKELKDQFVVLPDAGRAAALRLSPAWRGAAGGPAGGRRTAGGSPSHRSNAIISSWWVGAFLRFPPCVTRRYMRTRGDLLCHHRASDWVCWRVDLTQLKRWYWNMKHWNLVSHLLSFVLPSTLSDLISQVLGNIGRKKKTDYF